MSGQNEQFILNIKPGNRQSYQQALRWACKISGPRNIFCGPEAIGPAAPGPQNYWFITYNRTWYYFQISVQNCTFFLHALSTVFKFTFFLQTTNSIVIQTQNFQIFLRHFVYNYSTFSSWIYLPFSPVPISGTLRLLSTLHFEDPKSPV